MTFINKLVLLFHSINLCLVIILSNIYDWQGRYFMLGLVTYLIPNIIGLILNYVISALVQSLINANNLKKVILPVIFFIVNEVSYMISEKKIIFFGFYSSPISNMIDIDNGFYVIISLSALISSVVVFLKTNIKTSSF